MEFIMSSFFFNARDYEQLTGWSWVVLPAGTLIALVLVHFALSLVQRRVLTPLRITRMLEKQGVRGPPIRLLMGNSTAEEKEMIKLRESIESKDMADVQDYDILPRVLPVHDALTKQYGKCHLWWMDDEPMLTITDPKLVKEILLNKNGFATKNDFQLKGLTMLMGKGLVSTVGDEWSFHRRIVSPAFHHDRIKHMLGAMVESAVGMLDNLEKAVLSSGGGSVEVEMHKHMVDVTADIISRTAFGSSYEKGKKVFEEQKKLMNLLVLGAKATRALGNSDWTLVRIQVPWTLGILSDLKFLEIMGIAKNGYLPERPSFKMIQQHGRWTQALKELIQVRKDQIEKGNSASYGQDLLGLMMLAADEDASADLHRGGKANFDMQSLIGECKTFYFAGHETTSTLLTWTVVLLGAHTEWQDRARAEVLEVCGDRPVDADAIGNLKVLTMILNESLRLFPPVPLLVRTTARDVKLGELDLPNGVGLYMPLVAIHHDPELWGEDSMKFKPERFAQGVGKAGKHHSVAALLAFSFGPRNCVGQVFAMQEAKVVMAMLLRQFQFRLSPSYRHAPKMTFITLPPRHGVPLIVEKANT